MCCLGVLRSPEITAPLRPPGGGSPKPPCFSLALRGLSSFVPRYCLPSHHSLGTAPRWMSQEFSLNLTEATVWAHLSQVHLGTSTLALQGSGFCSPQGLVASSACAKAKESDN